MDPRQRRSRAKLSEAILDLATARPVAELTIAEITDRAGVHRSTFYDHATSPDDLLRTALLDELDALREKYLSDVEPSDAAAAVTAVTEAVFDHIARREAIYHRGLLEATGSASLHELLSAHFRESTRLLLAQRAFDIPFAVPGVAAGDLGDMVAHFVADGTAGAIEVWLRLPEPRSTETFLRIYEQLVPAWWPLVGNVRPEV